MNQGQKHRSNHAARVAREPCGAEKQIRRETETGKKSASNIKDTMLIAGEGTNWRISDDNMMFIATRVTHPSGAPLFTSTEFFSSTFAQSVITQATAIMPARNSQRPTRGVREMFVKVTPKSPTPVLECKVTGSIETWPCPKCPL